MHRRARVRPGGDPVPAGNYGTGLCVLAGPVEGGYNKINSRAPPQRPGAVRGGRFSRGPGGAMDRIELIRRLNGVLLDEMPAYRDRPPGSRTTCDLRCITKKYRRRATSPAKKTPDKTPPPKKRTGQMPSPLFLYLLRLSQSGLSSHSEAVSPEKALLEPAA